MLLNQKTIQEELSKLPTNADENHNSNFHSEPLDNTPFRIIGNSEVGYFLTMGKYRLTEHYNTVDEVIETINREQWLIISRMISCFFHKHDSEEAKDLYKEFDKS